MVCAVDFEPIEASLNPSVTKYLVRKLKNIRKDGLAHILKTPCCSDVEEEVVKVAHQFFW